MAIGLVILAGVIALPVAVLAWLLGFVSFGEAVLIYILAGWAVMAAGILSTVFGHLMSRTAVDDPRDAQAVPMKVKSVHRS